MKTSVKPIQNSEQLLLADLSQLIEQSKKFVIVQANSVMTMLFWKVGKQITEYKRADYGKQMRNLRRMMQFAELFSDLEILWLQNIGRSCCRRNYWSKKITKLLPKHGSFLNKINS